MRKTALSILSVIVLLAFSFPVQADQKSVLKAFEKLKASTATGVNLEKYRELVADASTEISLLKREKGADLEFITKAEECLKAHQGAVAYWEMKRSFVGPGGNYEMATRCDIGIQEKWKEASECLESLYDEFSKRGDKP